MEDIPLGSLYTALFILIILSGFFSSSETGLMAINRYRLKHLANSGHRGARLAQKLLTRPDRLIGLILLGNNMVNILAASIATVIAIRLFGDNGIWVSTLVMTVVVLIFAEVAPKTVAALHPEKIAFPASYVLTVLLKLLNPVVWLVNSFANFVRLVVQHPKPLAELSHVPHTFCVCFFFGCTELTSFFSFLIEAISKMMPAVVNTKLSKQML